MIWFGLQSSRDGVTVLVHAVFMEKNRLGWPSSSQCYYGPLLTLTGCGVVRKHAILVTPVQTVPWTKYLRSFVDAVPKKATPPTSHKAECQCGMACFFFFYFKRLEICLCKLLVLSWMATAIKRFSRAELCASFLDIPQFQHIVATSRLRVPWPLHKCSASGKI